MNCAWKEFLDILPQWLRFEVDALGRESLCELRLRLGIPPELVMKNKRKWLDRPVSSQDLSHCINAASRYSPWAANTASMGYLTANGGHRLGLCGDAVCQNGAMTGIREISSLCIRIARDFPGIAERIDMDSSLLILGAPGWGKTTLLRDLIRKISDAGNHIAVVDQRGELFPTGFPRGKCTDVLTGCGKQEGIPALIRTMGPAFLAVDEITEEADTAALLQAHGCGVKLLATAHASSLEDFRSRLVYAPLITHRVFQRVVVLQPDRQWHMERMA